MKKFSCKTLVIALSLALTTHSVMADDNSPAIAAEGWVPYLGQTLGYMGAATGTALGAGLNYFSHRNGVPFSLGSTLVFYGALPALGAVSTYALGVAQDQADQIIKKEAEESAARMSTPDTDPSKTEANTSVSPSHPAGFFVQAIPVGGNAGGGGGGDDPKFMALVAIPQPELVAQLNEITQNINANNNRVNILNDRVNHLEDQVHKNDKKAARGIAALAAMGNVATPSKPGKTAIGAGVGSYDGQQAVAFTISHRLAKLDRLVLQAGVGGGNNGKPVMRAGFSFEF